MIPSSVRPILDSFGAAMIAALIGSFIASVQFWGAQAWDDLSLAALPLVISLIFFTTLLAFFCALFATILIGIPITWPVRRWIVAHPLIAGPAYGVIGAFAGWAVHRSLDQSLLDDQYELMAMVCGAATASAWVYLLWKGR